MSTLRIAVFALLALACAPQRVVFTDDEVPLAAPLEAASDLDTVVRGDDPPTRVIRLNHAEGSVSRRPAGMDEWAAAPVNLPLGAGDSVWVASGGRAELHAGSTALRLAPDTGLDVLRLDNRALQVGLSRGSVQLKILQGPEVDSVEVDTPDGAVLLDRPGGYRVDVAEGGAPDRVTVRNNGLAEVTAAGVTVPVNAGSALELTGGDAPRYQTVAPGEDGFDRWCAVRDRREDSTDSGIYLGRAMTGYEDLDGHGAWRMDPTYGAVWAPRVAAGWAPYRDGRWVWSDPYGWTWVDAAPWAFAPSHYGRWAQSGGAWVWVPGPKTARPVYAPALVAFTGGPGLRGAASAGPGVAWFPLGPAEPYLPAYPASRGYVQSLNAGRTASGHVNRGALTAVPQSVFLGARPVAGAALAVGGPGLSRDWRVGSAPALVPLRESILATVPGAPPASRPPAQDRPLMVRNRLPLAAVPFEARQRALAAGQGRPLAGSALEGLRRQGPSRGIPARLATAPAPGGALRPASPGAFQAMPRPMLQPAPARYGNQGAPPLRPAAERFRPADQGRNPSRGQLRGPMGPSRRQGLGQARRAGQGRRPGAGKGGAGRRSER